MRWLARYLGICLAGWLLAFPCQAQALAAGTAGRFVFAGAGLPLTVHYYKASSATASAKVLIAIHGVERDGAAMRDHWRDWAERRSAIVLAPEFDRARFPNQRFQMGGMAEVDPARCSFALIEPLFAHVRAQEGLQAQTYWLFGHSAGAQFVHRFMLMEPAPHVALAIAANAGSYTLPVNDAKLYPYGYPWRMDAPQASPEPLRRALGRPLLVLLGERDTATTGKNLPRSPQALAQGPNRLERGRRFYALGQEQAARMHTGFGWRLATVPGVGHNARAMSRAAARWLDAQTH